MSRFPSRRAAMLAASLGVLLAGCSTPAVLQPAAERSGQSWVVTRPALAATLAQACPGGIAGEITDYWAPSRADVDRLEAALAQLPASIGTPVADDRQYVGVVSGQQRLVYVRGWPAADFPDADPSRHQAVPCDIGWHALYDPASGHFLHSGPASASY